MTSPTLFGLSVTNFNQSADLGNGELSMDINLFKCDGQIFTPSPVGSPVSFTYGTNFFGILDRYTRERGSQEAYAVRLTSGMDILNGVKLILNDYTGATNDVKNLHNIYGSLGFTHPDVGANGIYWRAIRDRIVYLSQQPAGTIYGGPVEYLGYKYGIDLSELPNVRSDYTIQNDGISVIDFVTEICELGGHEFFVELVSVAGTPWEAIGGYSGVFVVRTIDRTVDTDLGALGAFIDSQPCVVSSSLGAEKSENVHNKFLLGANVEALYFSTQDTQGDDTIEGGIPQSGYANNLVLPYFGLDTENNAIVGYTPNGHTDYFFDIDVRDIDHPEIGDTYTTSLKEIRAAKRGRESWERFLTENNANRYMIDRNVTDPTNANVTWEPFEVPIKKSDISTLEQLDRRIPHYLKTSYDDGTYQGIVIPKFGWGYAKTVGKRHNPKVDADASYPVSGFQHGAVGDTAIGNSIACYYPSSGNLENPYYCRASKLQTISSWGWMYARMFEFDLPDRANQNQFWGRAYTQFKKNMGNGGAFQEAIKSQIDAASLEADTVAGTLIDKTSQIYSRLRDLADGYYNKRFMVKVPEVQAKIDFQTQEIRTSHTTTQTGYLDETVWDAAADNGLIPGISGINRITDQNNKFYPFVKYENAYQLDGDGIILNSRYDLSEISYDDKIVQIATSGTIDNPQGIDFPTSSGSSVNLPSGTIVNIADVWVKCGVGENLVFENDGAKTGARAIINLPGVAAEPPALDTNTVKGRKALFETMSDVAQHFVFNHASIPNPQQAAINAASRATDGAGADVADLADGENLVYADLYAIPLRDYTTSYGPWYASASGNDVVTGLFEIGGKVEYERDTSLSPWNYGGYSNMNLAAIAAVSGAITNIAYDGTGSVELLGEPAYTIGGQVTTNSPYITDISVSWGDKQTTTTYNFQSWSDHRQLGKLKKFYQNKFIKQSKELRELRRNIREGFDAGIFRNLGQANSAVSRFMDLEKYTRKHKNNTSTAVLIGQNNGFTNTVALMPEYNMIAQAQSQYENKAIMSLDGIFTPYTTVPNTGSNFPSFTYVEGVDAGNPPTSKNLNIWESGNPTIIATQGDTPGFDSMTYPNRENYFVNPSGGEGNFREYRGMALKAPVIIGGWGYDTDMNPVPTHPSGGNYFHPEHRWNSSLWKVGPLDVRWDEDRGVWAAGGSDGTTCNNIVNVDCGCTCAEGTDITLLDGMPSVSTMLWVPPANLEIPSDSGILTIESEWYGADPFGPQGYPLSYVGTSGTGDVWTYSDAGPSGYLNFSARFPDEVDAQTGEVTQGDPASNWWGALSITFYRNDPSDSTQMKLVVTASGEITS